MNFTQISRLGQAMVVFWPQHNYDTPFTLRANWYGVEHLMIKITMILSQKSPKSIHGVEHLMIKITMILSQKSPKSIHT